MGKRESWHYEHDEFECPKCEAMGEEHRLNFYLGSHEDAFKYECTNADCDYVEIKTMDELMRNIK